jgi:sugar lactone lactonase YvrE
VLAAASVFVVAGASAGIAVALTSHHGSSSPSGTGMNSASPSASPSASASAPAERVADGIWGAELIDREMLTQDTLTGGASSLYAIAGGDLERIDPATGDVVTFAPVGASIANPPVVTGNTVWVVSSYAGNSVVLQGYDAKTLAQLASVTVPVSGQLPAAPEGVLASGSGGYLYVAAGSSVAVVNPSTHQVIKQISSSAGPVTSVAVSPDGSKLYASTTSSFDLATYNPATGAELGFSAVPGLANTEGNLVATSGGVWGTSGVGMTELTWFAPDAELPRMVRVGAGTGAGLDSVPTYSGGTVWIGGSHTLECADPATGQVLASVTIPTDGSVLEYFGSVTFTGGRAYAYYQDPRSQQSGVVTLTPPQC